MRIIPKCMFIYISRTPPSPQKKQKQKQKTKKTTQRGRSDIHVYYGFECDLRFVIEFLVFQPILDKYYGNRVFF